MAISLLRRTVSSRNLYFVRSSAAAAAAAAAGRSRDFSYSCSCFSNSYVTSETPPPAAAPPLFGAGTHYLHDSIVVGGGGGSIRIGFDFLKESRRGFAKGRKSKDGDGGNSAVATIDVGPIKTSTASLMDAALDSLSRELSKLRTGRASAGMLDHIIIETSGVKMPLSRMAVVSVIDAQTLSVTPYDPNAIKELENAIVSSPLGVNPKLDGQRLIAPIPPLTKESMQAMCKVVTKSSEDVKQSIRRARQKALDTIKKAATSIPKDDVKRLEKEIDEMTKKFVKSAEDMCKAKEKEITSG